MKPEDIDIEARRPVWEALSTLFLDTDVTLLRDYRVGKLAESPYTLDELEEILREEVFPVCSWNLFSVAGVWSGFDQEFLEKAIMKRMRRRFKMSLGLGRSFITRSEEWKHTKAAIQEKRVNCT